MNRWALEDAEAHAEIDRRAARTKRIFLIVTWSLIVVDVVGWLVLGWLGLLFEVR